MGRYCLPQSTVVKQVKKCMLGIMPVSTALETVVMIIMVVE